MGVGGMKYRAYSLKGNGFLFWNFPLRLTMRINALRSAFLMDTNPESRITLLIGMGFFV